MYFYRLMVAAMAMFLSLLCFDSVGVVETNDIAAEELTPAARMAVFAAEEFEVIGEGVLPELMAGCSAQAAFGPAIDTEAAGEVAPDAIIRAEARRRAEEQKRIEAERKAAEEAEKRRIAAEREAEKRRIAEEKAAKEAALRAACPGYDDAFVATLTAEEQAEARYFYEQGYVFYRQNWSVLKNAPYGDCGFGQCGCGPTCVAAIISNLAGVPVDPEEMRVYGLSVGSWLSTGGTTYGFLISTAQKYGISATQIYAGDRESLFAALRDENKLVLATMGPGDFTLGAHFMLFRGITDEGKILIADSYSFEHSVKEWDYDELYAQLKTGYWIFSREN
ncbi:MAG: C39 family peptidase [Clostridia bacterium]|nr:C39 family peptidase [Clostridia bacterium]